jgi:hypothetical protein
MQFLGEIDIEVKVNKCRTVCGALQITSKNKVRIIYKNGNILNNDSINITTGGDT